MKKLSFTALLVVIVAATWSVPGYLSAQGCDPSSGCCGAGQTYVGRQLFQNQGVPSQASVRPAAKPQQPMKANNATGSTRKTLSTQTRTEPIVPAALQAAVRPGVALSFSLIPFFGTLW
jgi:hypothetical protein